MVDSKRLVLVELVRMVGLFGLVGLVGLTGLAVAANLVAARGDERRAAAFDVIVIDPGHGGPDHGARGAAGLLEKDVVLEVSKRIGAKLQKAGVEIVYTRADDRFVALPERTDIANRARADLYLSIHANSSPDDDVQGPETYFLSLDASDDEARRVALIENRVFDRDDAVPDGDDLVATILADLIRTEHLRGSGEAAHAIQRELERLPGKGRGVKQAPFVVLMGVNMPAALVEIGFLSHAAEERALRDKGHQRAIAGAVAQAVLDLRESRAAANSARGVQ